VQKTGLGICSIHIKPQFIEANLTFHTVSVSKFGQNGFYSLTLGICGQFKELQLVQASLQ
jgi:hypothetical protein